MILEILLAGGVLYAGVNTFRNRKRKKKPVWLVEHGSLQTATDTSIPDEAIMARLEKKINRDFVISSVSLGMSLTGTLAYPPLGLASVPLTIYGAIPTFEDTYEVIFNQGRAKLAVISSIVIIGSLGASYYFIASLFQWGHHLNKKLVLELDYSYRQFLVYIFGPKSHSVWILVNDVEVRISREELKVGDTVIVNEGEIIPVDGTIIDGDALIDMYVLTGQSRPVEKKPGDLVFAATGLLSGRICVRVKKV